MPTKYASLQRNGGAPTVDIIDIRCGVSHGTGGSLDSQALQAWPVANVPVEAGHRGMATPERDDDWWFRKAWWQATYPLWKTCGSWYGL